MLFERASKTTTEFWEQSKITILVKNLVRLKSEKRMKQRKEQYSLTPHHCKHFNQNSIFAIAMPSVANQKKNVSDKTSCLYHEEWESAIKKGDPFQIAKLSPLHSKVEELIIVKRVFWYNTDSIFFSRMRIKLTLTNIALFISKE